MSGNKANKEQKVIIGVLVTKLGLQKRKKEMTLGFSGGRTDTTTDLTPDEARAYIKYLKSQDPDEIAADKMRKKIISMAHELGYRIPGTTKVDMIKLDEWCIKYGHKHKKLNQYLVDELPLLVTQFEKRYDSHVKNI